LTVLNIKLSKDEIRQVYADLGRDIREKINYDDFLEIVTPRLPDRHTKEYIRGVNL
jgi:Ca2+-binding EF-hand superfamily protein